MGLFKPQQIMNLVGQLGGDRGRASEMLGGLLDQGGQVDTEHHGGLLESLGIDPHHLASGGYQDHIDQQQRGEGPGQGGFGGYQDQGRSDQGGGFDDRGGYQERGGYQDRSGYGGQPGGYQDQRRFDQGGGFDDRGGYQDRGGDGGQPGGYHDQGRFDQGGGFDDRGGNYKDLGGPTDLDARQQEDWQGQGQDDREREGW